MSTPTILVTGASTGIGAAIAARLAPQRHIIVHYNRSVGPAEATADAVRQRGGSAEILQADLSTEAGCVALADAVANRHSHLEALINNAGALIARKNATDLTWQHLMDTFALNTFSVMRLSGLLVPLLRAGTRPSIIMMTSIAMRHGAPTATAYGAAKGALDSFTRGLAKELAPHIRVNAIAPGVIKTPFHDRVSTPEKMKTWADNTPVGFNGDPDHIASAVEFLLANTFITGETLDINGGLGMR